MNVGPGKDGLSSMDVDMSLISLGFYFKKLYEKLIVESKQIEMILL